VQKERRKETTKIACESLLSHVRLRRRGHKRTVAGRCDMASLSFGPRTERERERERFPSYGRIVDMKTHCEKTSQSSSDLF
jgi:hypothetical protein